MVDSFIYTTPRCHLIGDHIGCELGDQLFVVQAGDGQFSVPPVTYTKDRIQYLTWLADGFAIDLAPNHYQFTTYFDFNGNVRQLALTKGFCCCQKAMTSGN